MALQLEMLTPKQALNKAFLKRKVFRGDFDIFKNELISLLSNVDEEESEEHVKNLLAIFLRKTFYESEYQINTKGKTDLVISGNPRQKDAWIRNTTQVLLEVKKPTNKSEMISANNLNVKALHELVLYYLRERENEKNGDIKHVVITNIYEWYIFDVQNFEQVFHKNKELVEDFRQWQAGKKTNKTTDFFYQEIVKPFISSSEASLKVAYFDLRHYQQALTEETDEKKLIALFKLLSPDHLLKKFQYDSNQLDRGFYEELLHVMGLEEVSQGGLNLIKRKPAAKREAGSILENTIQILESSRKVEFLAKRQEYGTTLEEQIFHVALELSLTWVNRLLFLKLLEGQLLNFNKGSAAFRFLSAEKLPDYDEVYKLFFEVLAKKEEERRPLFRAAFAHIPYLNSSLFEISELEIQTLSIHALNNRAPIRYYERTVLVDEKGIRKEGETLPLAYFLQFLDAYDFAAEGTEEIQTQRKRLINASVLGLIFEKINGYKEGSFFTPGFITMYMARETVRKAVVTKFNTHFGWQCQTFDDLDAHLRSVPWQQANALVNDLRICDPSVGSGHFLVSVLNEILVVKSDLNLLYDKKGKMLRIYRLLIDNDELSVTYADDGEVFEYFITENRFGERKINEERQRVQETIFYEKKYIIENCLFGVDINPNSVKICRLRLWIELLKHTFYKPEGGVRELEILPNLDINIKVGNSLLSRFELHSDLKDALRKSKLTIEAYQQAVANYRKATVYEEKRELKQLISQIKENFSQEISRNDPDRKRLHQLKGEWQLLMAQQSFTEETEKEQKNKEKKKKLLEAQISSLEQILTERETGRLYRQAFEWRFEFPEVLNEDGDFMGFDLIIGNPPYYSLNYASDLKILDRYYSLYDNTSDIYVLFFELGLKLLKTNADLSFITANKWLKAGYGEKLRVFLKNYKIHNIVDFGDLSVFPKASAYPAIIQIKKDNSQDTHIKVAIIENLNFKLLYNKVKETEYSIPITQLEKSGWHLSNPKKMDILKKVQKRSITLNEYINGQVYRGILTGLNEAFIIDLKTKNELTSNNEKNKELIRPFAAGRDIKNYIHTFNDKYIILIPKGWTKAKFNTKNEEKAWQLFSQSYNEIANHLLPFEEKARKRQDKGDFWWEVRACDYYSIFEQDKIMYQAFQVSPAFCLDKNKVITNNSVWLIPTNDKYLLAYLNSKISWFLISQYCTQIRNGYQLIYQYLGRIPIFALKDSEKISFETLVNQILEAKSLDSEAEVSHLEKEIDRLIYQLYELDEAEIKIIEQGL